MASKIIKIEPCICGGTRGAGYHQTNNEGGQVVCYSCPRRGPMNPTPKEAIEAWNEETIIIAAQLMWERRVEGLIHTSVDDARSSIGCMEITRKNADLLQAVINRLDEKYIMSGHKTRRQLFARAVKRFNKQLQVAGKSPRNGVSASRDQQPTLGDSRRKKMKDTSPGPRKKKKGVIATGI